MDDAVTTQDAPDGGSAVGAGSGQGASIPATVDAQHAARQAGEDALSRYDAGAAGGASTTADPSHSGAAPSREERLAEIEALREAHREEFHERGLGLEAEALEADEDGEGADAGENAEQQAEGEGDGDAGEVGSSEGDGDAPPSVPTDPEERAAFFPEDSSGYELPQRDVEAAQPDWQSFATVAHELGLSQAALDRCGQWYEGRIAEIHDGLVKADAGHAKAARAALTETWGDEATHNIEVAKEAYKAALPQEFRALLRETRLPNGRKLVNEPAFVQMLATLAKAQAPSVDSRLKEIRHIMRTDIDRYRSENLDAELLELEARKEKGPASAGVAPVHDSADQRRIAELRTILRADRESYFARGLDREFQELLAKQGTKKGPRGMSGPDPHRRTQ
jgi:hypothetical protein